MADHDERKLERIGDRESWVRMMHERARRGGYEGEEAKRYIRMVEADRVADLIGRERSKQCPLINACLRTIVEEDSTAEMALVQMVRVLAEYNDSVIKDVMTLRLHEMRARFIVTGPGGVPVAPTGCYAVGFTCPAPIVEGWNYCAGHLQAEEGDDAPTV